jgi:predicted secreted protein
MHDHVGAHSATSSGLASRRSGLESRPAQVLIAIAVVGFAVGTAFIRGPVGTATITWLSGITHGGTVPMAVAGGLTFALLPIGIRLTRADATSRLTTAPSSATVRWIQRTPLILAIALALVFFPGHELSTTVVASWNALPGGRTFLAGSHWALAFTLVAMVLGIPMALRDRLPRFTRWLPALPLIGILIAILTH